MSFVSLLVAAAGDVAMTVISSVMLETVQQQQPACLA